MASPCVITYQGKQYAYEEFATMLHDGLLNKLIERGDVDASIFVGKAVVKQEAKKEKPVGEAVVEKPVNKVSNEDVSAGILHHSNDGKYDVVKTNAGLKVFDKSGKEMSKTTSAKVINEYLKAFDFEKGESAFEGMPEGTINESETDRHIAEHSEKPSEIIDAYTRLKSEAPIIEGDYIDDVIANNMSKVTGKSYENWGDKNNVTMGKAKSYFSESKGEPIDTLAQHLSITAGVEITPEHIVEFIDRYPNGVDQYFRSLKNPLLRELSDKLKDVTGFNMSDKVINAYMDQRLNTDNKIVQEYLNKELESYEQYQREFEQAIKDGRITFEDIRPTVAEEDGAVKRGEEGATGEEGVNPKFQSETAEPLASVNPELHKKIAEHLGKLFPNVKVFGDAELFQRFLDRNFPGAKLDLSKLGAAIGNVIYINPNRAVQSTALHEYAHIYWDALPESDPLKKKISALFPSEEAAIIAIGKLGTKAAEMKLKGSKLLKFVQHVKEFWAKVKNAFGIANKEDLVKIFASDLWKNVAKVEAIQEGKQGPVKFQAEESTPEQERTVEQLQNIADHFDYDPIAHTYTLAGTETEYKPVNDILQSDPRYAYKGKPNGEAGKRGNDLHTLAEALVKGEDFEAALAKTKLKFTDEAKEQFRSQINKAVESLRSKGQILPETIFANGYYKTAGRPDLPIVAKDGTLHIYDFKTSTITTEGNKLYEEGTEKKASKKERDGVQLAMYAKLAEHGDQSLGLSPQKIGEVGIIPVRLTIGENGEITKVTVEKTVDVPYNNYRDEASRLLSKQHAEQRATDAKEMKYKGAKTKDQYMKHYKIDRRALEDELLGLEDTPEENARREEIYNILETAEKNYETYKEQFQIVKGLQDADLENMSYEQLVDAMNAINSYDSLTHNIAMKEIQVEAGRRMTQMETERLAKAGVKAGAEKDIRQRDVFFKALSDISEDLPALQGRIREYFSAKQAEETEHANVDREAKKLFSDVIKANESKVGKLTKAFDKADLSKYFDNLFIKKQDENGPAVLKDWKDLSNDLKPSERAVLKFMDEKMSEFQKKQALSERGVYDGFYAAISPNFWEAYHKNGFLSALGEKFRQDQPEELGDMEVTVNIDGDKKVMTYDEAEKLIKQSGEKGLLNKASASLKLARAYAEAKKELDKYTAKHAGTESAVKVRGAASRFTLNDNGEMVGKFHWKRDEAKDISYDVYRSFMSYMTDAIHVKHMQPLLPEITALQEYYKQRGANPNTLEFMRHWIEGDIFGKEFVGTLGREVDAGIKFLQAWTYFNVMSFNPTVGFYNFTTGKMNQLRAAGLKTLAKGEKRYFSNPTKAQGVLQHYTVIEPVMHGPAKYSAGNIWGFLANGFVSMGENSIRGAAFFSHMTDAEYKKVMDNFDKDGNIIDKSKDLAPGRVFELKKKTEDIQGKYAFADKRMYKHYGMMSAMMGFKGWMPDWIKERFGKEYTDMYGVTHKGAYRSIPYTMRDLKNAFVNFRGDDVNAVNNRKNIREAMMIATMMGIYATTQGSSKEEKKHGALLLTMTTDLIGLMNLSRTKSTLGKPFPFMGTVTNFIDMMTSLATFYAKDSTYGSKGDWMFPSKVLNVLPYNHLAKGAISLAQ